ncbi:hypothetical protein [Nocardia sp. NPDC051750]|uniref:hypothetical protein n=1 Tax=Nocardia sp. NPDC051750 TaxID=3364325 RepID=UPI0037A02A86
MRHVIAEATDVGTVLDPTVYLKLLPTFAENLPVGARAFATHAQHYDFAAPRCIKDLGPDTVLAGDTAGDRWLELGFRHNCWKHEEDLVIRYSGVREMFPTSSFHPPTWAEHNTITLDEVLPHETGCRHEIRLLSGSITIISRDLEARWVETNCSS